MWVGLGRVGSWVMIVVILWVGLGMYVCGLGWVVSYENGPMDNSVSLSITPTLYHLKLKRYLFLKSFPPYVYTTLPSECLYGRLWTA